MTEQDLEYIKETYGVPAVINGRIKFGSKLGTIVGANGPHLKIKIDGEKDAGSYHPTWNIEYDVEE